MSDEGYQNRILPHVSRTFALTIPELPADLRTAVTCAYLLCRIADTIEDEPEIGADDGLIFLERFTAVVAGTEAPAPLAADLGPRLSRWTLPAERELVANMERVIRVAAGLDMRSRAAIQRCVALMCHGMHHFQRTASLAGLPALADLDGYCYYVAGVVGEMLTELFCGHSPDIECHQARLAVLAPSFAQGLQMTNILKDVWEDRSRGACWLPQSVFARHGVDLAGLGAGELPAGFAAGMQELVGVAHAHLRNALEFTLLLPRAETGIRRFCLWAIGLAVLTLRRVHANPRFTAGSEVKVPRSQVRLTLAACNLAVRSNGALQFLFGCAARGLPLAVLPPGWAPKRLPTQPAAAGQPLPLRRRAAGAGAGAEAAEDWRRRPADRSSAP
ncbi:MAG TPA: phytoene/squalene synthase family protein [Steroidobacteraceae bacterium]|nr:phytoene/squalene synthase family protein [Steroidobacteraceae bacterium]